MKGGGSVEETSDGRKYWQMGRRIGNEVEKMADGQTIQ